MEIFGHCGSAIEARQYPAPETNLLSLVSLLLSFAQTAITEPHLALTSRRTWVRVARMGPAKLETSDQRMLVLWQLAYLIAYCRQVKLVVAFLQSLYQTADFAAQAQAHKVSIHLAKLTRMSQYLRPSVCPISPFVVSLLPRSDVFVLLFCSISGSLKNALRSLRQRHRSADRAEKDVCGVYCFACAGCD